MIHVGFEIGHPLVSNDQMVDQNLKYLCPKNLKVLKRDAKVTCGNDSWDAFGIVPSYEISEVCQVLLHLPLCEQLNHLRQAKHPRALRLFDGQGKAAKGAQAHQHSYLQGKQETK